MRPYITPGVYVEEISKFPPSVAQVPTAIPAFIGCTETGHTLEATRIESLKEFEKKFGGPQKAKFTVHVQDNTVNSSTVTLNKNCILYYCLQLYFSNGGGPCYIVSIGDFQTTKDVAAFKSGIDVLKKVDEPTLIILPEAVGDLTTPADYGEVTTHVLSQCELLKDRFGVFDYDYPKEDQKNQTESFRGILSNDPLKLKYGAVYTPFLQTIIPYVYDEQDVTILGAKIDNPTAEPGFNPSGLITELVTLRDALPNFSKKEDVLTAKDGIEALKLKIDEVADLLINKTLKDDPDLQPSDAEMLQDLKISVQEAWENIGNSITPVKAVRVIIGSVGNPLLPILSALIEIVAPMNAPLPLPTTLSNPEIKEKQTLLYNNIIAHLERQRIVLPPSSAMVGIYAQVDRQRGVWKAPANVSVSGLIGPVSQLTNEDQGSLNVDPTTGKSINVIRSFAGKGTIVWGARTMAGNDKEWRYINVRRLFITIEESVQKATAFAVFEPNDATTWLKVKAMIDSYLYGLWQQGALAGASPEDSYYVHVGLGKTMDQDDILDGNLIVEIGIAAVRPAEFIILKFSHKLQES